MDDMKHIKAMLEDKLDELNARAEEIDHDLHEPPDRNWSENAQEHEGDEVLEEVGAVTVDEIQHVKLALAKIEAGTYGACAECGGKIALGRLEALPYAVNCIDCAEKAA